MYKREINVKILRLFEVEDVVIILFIIAVIGEGQCDIYLVNYNNSSMVGLLKSRSPISPLRKFAIL